jgi:hypothetical protein
MFTLVHIEMITNVKYLIILLIIYTEATCNVRIFPIETYEWVVE